jgi:hypothetical protein
MEAMWERGQGDYWWIGVCNNCNNAVLVHNEGASTTIYPHAMPSPTDPRIPEPLSNDLQEAKKCFTVEAYRGCAVMARRAIQSACCEKGSDKDRLVDQLHQLAVDGVITKDLREWADVVRWIGNDAAHPGSGTVTRDEAEDILSLAEQFMNTVFVAPAIAKERKDKLGK